MSDVVTGEAVELDLRVAQLPSRIVAAMIDFVVMLAALWVLLLVVGLSMTVGGGDDALAAALSVVLTVGVFLGYPVVFESLTRGRTLGKMAIGLRAVRDDGGPITFRHALVRGLVGLALERPGIFLLGLGPALGMIVSMLSANGKRIGDMAAGTMVLQERISGRPPWLPWMPAPLVWWASTLDLTGLDDSLALAVRQFLGRAAQLYPAAREELGRQLSEEVRERTTPPPPPGTPGWAYLSAVLAERRHREEARAAVHAGRPAPPMAIWPPPGPPLWWYAAGPPPAGHPAGSPYAPAPPPGPPSGPAAPAGSPRAVASPAPGRYGGPRTGMGYAGGYPPPAGYGGGPARPTPGTGPPPTASRHPDRGSLAPPT